MGTVCLTATQGPDILFLYAHTHHLVIEKKEKKTIIVKCLSKNI